MYIKSAQPSVRGNKAELKSLLLPSAGENGYCFKFWFHMFGATVGSLRVLLQTAEPLKKTLVNTHEVFILMILRYEVRREQRSEKATLF